MKMATDIGNLLPRPLATAAALVLCTLAATAARADAADTFNVTASYSLLHDDNLFRLSPDAAIDSHYAPRYDTVHTLGIIGSIDKTISRQQLHADLTVQDNRYVEHRFLNNQPYSGTVAWAWQLGENLSGLLKHANTRNISSFENYQSVMKDIYRTRTDSASARYRVHPDWFVEGFAQSYTSSHSLLLTSDVDVRETRLSIMNLRPSGDQAQVRLIRREGNYPNQGGGVDYQYDERQLDAMVTLVLTGASSVTGSFGHLQRSNPYAPERDFSGQIGRLTWNWMPTGKLAMIASVERSLGAKEDITSTFALTDTLHLAAIWGVTEKMQAQVSVDRWRSDYRGVNLPAWIPQRRDDGRTFGAGVNYQVNRNLVAAAKWTYSRRDTAHPDFALYYFGVVPYYLYAGIPYRDNMVWFSLQYTFGFGG